jgi:hypothetical protein
MFSPFDLRGHSLGSITPMPAGLKRSSIVVRETVANLSAIIG